MGMRRRVLKASGAVVMSVAVLVLGALPHPATATTNAAPPSLRFCLAHVKVACLNPAQMRAIYGVDSVIQQGDTGKGRTIAIVDSFGSPTIVSDLHAFDRAFGLPDPQLTVLAPLGVKHPADTGWVAETTLDVEWAHAVAPGARIVLLESPVDETEGVQGLPEFLKLERYALAHRLADVISQSWAATEDTLFDSAGRQIVAQFHQFYAEAARRGVTVVTASGDGGTAGLDLSLRHAYPYRTVQWPASEPLVLGVGGTSLTVDPNGRLKNEVAWSGSGGGLSKFYSTPAYQMSLPTAERQILNGRRGVPDVAYNASNDSPVLIYIAGHWRVVGGTSAATPQWAGVIALADQRAGRDLGSVNASLYRLASSSSSRNVFRDITVGSISGPDSMLKGYSAGIGWDAATGLGAPRAAALIPALVRLAAQSSAR